MTIMKSLKQFIEESMINEKMSEPCSLEMAHKLFDEFAKNFKIESIPLEARKSALKDLEEINQDYWECSWECMAGLERIQESLSENPTSTRKVIEDLKKKYKLSDYLFSVVQPFEVEIVKVKNIPNYLVTNNAVLIADVNKNLEIITNEMKRAGYYMSRKYTYQDQRLNRKFFLLIFDPTHQDDIATQIRNNFKYLYHFTPLKNHKSITENGIVPRNEGRVYKYYQDRVYLLTVDNKNKQFIEMIKNVSSNRKKNDPSFDGRFMLYEIEVDRLPEIMKFYYDPHGADCIYTTEKIPYSTISKEEEIQV